MALFSRVVRRHAVLLVAVLTGLVLVAGVVTAVPVLARKSAYQPLKPQLDRSVPGSNGKPLTRGPDPAAAAALKAPLPAPVWPAAGTARVDLSATADQRARERGPVRAGALPVAVDRAAEAGPAAAATVPGSVDVTVLDRATADRAHRPVLLRVGRADGSATAGRVRVSVDYSTFATAYGADWGSRLRLTALPDCALTTPGAAGCQAVALPSRNSTTGRTVSADVALPAATTALVALDAGPSGSSGDFTATALAPSSTWSAGGSSGDFGWSYPLRMPPSLGGPKPDITFAYSAQSVDGRTAASNNQPGWLGEGFDFWPGYIERRYKACADDMGGTANNSTKTGDECWGTDNAMLSLHGTGGEMVRDDATGAWHPKTDDGSRVEHLTGAANGDDNGEYWRVTTSDGTQYYFGLNRITGWTAGRPETNSAWSVPVFGNNPGEPCHTSSFSSSWCQQAYRWNLDYVVDPHGNTMSYWYTTETNNYARNLTQSSVSSYVRGGVLARVDYGTRQDAEFGNPPMRVVLQSADRCAPGGPCDFAHPTSWPDTPLDQNCSSSTSCTDASPTFWTQKRLASITTQVSDGGSGYRDVERWTLNQTFPDPGDSTRPGLWLASISHTGLVGGSLDTPDVRFTGVQLPNRVDTSTDQRPAMNWWRISYIDTEAGGRIGVSYLGPDCVAGSRMPASPQSNTLRCFPVYWTPSGATNPTLDWFHKYVVDSVTETDMTGASPRVITKYGYPNPPAWHYNDEDGLVPLSRRTWAAWRGYDKVTTTKGDPGEQTYTETRYFRGMDGDHLPSGTRSVQIDGIADNDAFAGTTRETVTFNGPGGAEVGASVSDPWMSGPRSTRTIAGTTVYARHTGTATARTRTPLDGGRGTRTATVTTTYDDTYGQPVQIADAGDDADPDDDRCTSLAYARNTGAWILDGVTQARTVALPCGRNPATEDDLIADTRTSYDGQAWGAAPTRGDATTTEVARAFAGGVTTYVVSARSTYDAYGRVTDRSDLRGNHTTTVYTPATGGPLTRAAATGPLGTVTTDIEPAWGTTIGRTDENGRRTDTTHDPLGRLTAVWKPNRAKATQTASVTYAYQLATGGLNAVVTSTLNAVGAYVTSYALSDGLLRARQIQAPAVGAGRILTDTFYDTAGRVVKTNGAYYNADSGPGTTVFNPQDNQVPTQAVNVYDGAGRVTTSILKSNGVEKWRSGTNYGGDHTDVTPPAGAIPTSTYTDARGHTTLLRQYKGATPTGANDATAYTYNRRDLLAAVTDAAGNQWTYSYDLLGHPTVVNDPDSGRLTRTFNDNGDLLTATDARGVTLAFSYDTLGRRTGIYDGSTSGPKRAEFVYDTLAKGQLTSSTRWVNGNAYVTAVRDYTALYQPTGTTITVPASEGPLAGTYQFTNTYNPDGSPATVRMPAAGGLSAETITYGYDQTSGMPTRLTTSYGGVPGASYVIDAQYTRFGEASVVTYATALTGAKLAQQGTYYDEATRRISETVTAKETAPSTVTDAHYTYAPGGLITKIADTPAGGAADTQCFGYDPMQRLTEAWTPGNGDCAAAPTTGGLGGAAPYWQSFTYDAAGNRLTQTDHVTANGSATTTYTYGAVGSGHAHALAGTSTVDSSGTRTASYGYDSAGDTTTRPGAAGAQTLAWDNEGKLTSVADSTGTNAFTYDASGNRLISRDASGATLFLGAMELRLAASTNTVSATRYYTFAGRTFAMRTPAGVKWMTGDNHGSSLVTIDAGTQQVTHRYLLPFGGARGPNPSWPNPHGFVGGTTESSGLTYLGARAYDGQTGRFVSVDPVVDPGDPQQLNPYAYAGSSPVTMSDADGQYLCWDGGGGCGRSERREPPVAEPPDLHPPDLPPGAGPNKNVYGIRAGHHVYVVKFTHCSPGPCMGDDHKGYNQQTLGIAVTCSGMYASVPPCYLAADGYVHDLYGNQSACMGGVMGPCAPPKPDAPPVIPIPKVKLVRTPPVAGRSCLPPPPGPVFRAAPPGMTFHHDCDTELCKVANFFSTVSTAAGFVPGVACEACGAVSLVTGLVSAGFYAAAGEYKQAAVQAGSTIVGEFVGQGVAKGIDKGLAKTAYTGYSTSARRAFAGAYLRDNAENFAGYVAGWPICVRDSTDASTINCVIS
jgi:RHS repeat-associated protein